MHPITSTHLTSVRRQDYEAAANRHRVGRLDRPRRTRSGRTSTVGLPSGWLAQLTPARWRVRRSTSATAVSC